MRAATKETVIELPQRGGVRGRLERLHQEYLTKAHALRLAADILEEDDRRQALERAPQKFLAALNHRAVNGNGNGQHVEERERIPIAESKQQLLEYVRDHPGQTSREVAEGLGWKQQQMVRIAAQTRGLRGHSNGKGKGYIKSWYPSGAKPAKVKADKPASGIRAKGVRPVPASAINGQALSLFLLEHLDNEAPKTRETLMEDLAQAGSPLMNKQRFNGPMYAGLLQNGYAKEGKDGFVRTAKGNAYAGELRADLERLGKVPTGGYLL